MTWHKYTDEERAFFQEYVPGHSHKEIRAAFEERFDWPIEINQVKAYIKNHKLNTGRTGRFEKRCVPPNKGRKGICAPGCEKGWFQKGHIPQNHRPLGSERVNVDGYVEIKVAEPNKWRLKQRVVWEAHNGAIPEKAVIIFADGDKLNTDINNLRIIGRDVHAVMNHTGLVNYKGDFKDTAIAIAELKRKTSTCKRKNS